MISSKCAIPCLVPMIAQPENFIKVDEISTLIALNEPPSRPVSRDQPPWNIKSRLDANSRDFLTGIQDG